MSTTVKFVIPYEDKDSGFSVSSGERADVVKAEKDSGQVLVTIRKNNAESQLRAVDLVAIAFYE